MPSLADDNLAKTATGEDGKTLMWLAAGAAVGAALLAPLIMRWLGLSFPIALILGGGLAAWLFRKSEIPKRLGQGAALFGVASVGVALLGPMLGGIVGRFVGNTNTAAAEEAATQNTGDNVFVGA